MTFYSSTIQRIFDVTRFCQNTLILHLRNQRVARNGVMANSLVLIGAMYIAGLFYLYFSTVIIKWMLLVVTLIAVRVILIVQHRYVSDVEEDVWITRYAMTTLFIGLCWGGLLFYLPAKDNLFVMTNIFLLYTCINTFSLFIIVDYLRLYYQYTVPILILVLWYTWLHTTTDVMIMTLWYVGFSLVTYLIAYYGNRLQRQNDKLTIRNRSLLHNLQVEVKQREKMQSQMLAQINQLEEKLLARDQQLLARDDVRYTAE